MVFVTKHVQQAVCAHLILIVHRLQYVLLIVQEETTNVLLHVQQLQDVLQILTVLYLINAHMIVALQRLTYVVYVHQMFVVHQALHVLQPVQMILYVQLLEQVQEREYVLTIILLLFVEIMMLILALNQEQ